MIWGTFHIEEWHKGSHEGGNMQGVGMLVELQWTSMLAQAYWLKTL